MFNFESDDKLVIPEHLKNNIPSFHKGRYKIVNDEVVYNPETRLEVGEEGKVVVVPVKKGTAQAGS